MISAQDIAYNIIANPLDQLDGAAWDHGAPLADVKRLVEHWKTNFDWYGIICSVH